MLQSPKIRWRQGLDPSLQVPARLPRNEIVIGGAGQIASFRKSSKPCLV